MNAIPEDTLTPPSFRHPENVHLPSENDSFSYGRQSAVSHRASPARSDPGNFSNSDAVPQGERKSRAIA
jgi:hypothetical protein